LESSRYRKFGHLPASGRAFRWEDDMHDDDVIKGRTTFARATREHYPEFEHTVAAAVSTAIAQVSLVTDANAMVLRTGEIIAALDLVAGNREGAP
jgi:hypothetical protein